MDNLKARLGERLNRVPYRAGRTQLEEFGDDCARIALSQVPCTCPAFRVVVDGVSNKCRRCALMEEIK